jgi:hypothetical protein
MNGIECASETDGGVMVWDVDWFSYLYTWPQGSRLLFDMEAAHLRGVLERTKGRYHEQVRHVKLENRKHIMPRR